MTDDIVAALVAANRALGAAGHSDMVWGHVSIVDPAGRGVWMKASGWAFEEVTEERVVLVSPTGEVLEGSGRRHLEYPIHTQIVAARPDVGAVVHTHAPSAVAFASLNVPLRPISHDAIMFVNPDIPRFTQTGALIADAETGDALAATVGAQAGALIPGHGLVTVGSSVAEAVMRAVLLNKACEIQLAAMAAGGPAQWSDDDEVALKKATVASPALLQSGYDYLVRRAGTETGPR
ncbi:MAG TPA: class II aldolase/adducin family protein [Pseudolysinimonas sp.]|nr:class II aldolase/adducin family protein [Pseudolysinimonas sp.]